MLPEHGYTWVGDKVHLAKDGHLACRPNQAADWIYPWQSLGADCKRCQAITGGPFWPEHSNIPPETHPEVYIYERRLRRPR